MKHTYILFFICLFFIGCDRPECDNTNPVFDRYTPETNEYKTELARQIKRIGMSDINYWIGAYTPKNGRDYITVYAQGDSLCALMILDITKGEEFEYYKKVKGGGYHGAGLAGLKYHIIEDSTGTQFIYDDVDYILD